MSELRYYRIKNHYFAATSREDISNLIGDPKSQTSLASTFSYDNFSLNIERISEEEAKKAPKFERFANNGYRLCTDRTYSLGLT